MNARISGEKISIAWLINHPARAKNSEGILPGENPSQFISVMGKKMVSFTAENGFNAENKSRVLKF